MNSIGNPYVHAFAAVDLVENKVFINKGHTMRFFLMFFCSHAVSHSLDSVSHAAGPFDAGEVGLTSVSGVLLQKGSVSR